MRILVTGGTGVVGAGVLPELIDAGHEVRLLSRHATDEARKYPKGISAIDADVTDARSLRGAAEDCDAVVHIAGIVDETAELTFENVNVAGTRNILAEAERAGVKRFIFVSSLGAERGQSDYHKSKLRAEEIVRASALDWIILRPGNVYGPGDEVISALLKMVRALPAVPVVGWGNQRFQPIWFEDFGKVVAGAIEEDAMSRRVVEVAGNEITTATEVIELLGKITDRPAKKIPVPAGIVSAVTKVAERSSGLIKKAGLSMPISASKLQMLVEENVIADGNENGLEAFSIPATPLEVGLRRLANELPELLPEDGVGAMERKRFSATIRDSKLDAAELIAEVRERIGEVMPLDLNAEPGSDDKAEPKATLTGAIPGRGHFQVRAAETSENEIKLLTVEGHPLAGMVTIAARDLEDGIEVSVETNVRAANAIDWLAIRSFGGMMQDRNWRQVIQNIIKLSGGSAGEIQFEATQLSDEEARRVNELAREAAAA